ncbi:MAG: hypothetical protein AAFX59_08790, partial [Pseudomonadota bacterium]
DQVRAMHAQRVRIIENLARGGIQRICAELIEDSVTAHAALKKRNQGVVDDQIAQSRDKVAAALTSLEGAFDAAEERAANILLTQVDVASSTAETLLAPRHTRPTPQPQEDHP